ncbi:BolA domain UV induced protein Uvi31 [Coemansia sp. Benny D115]|nr:BolA domain UV induced protein Uvi31 [Coemansia sp. Benny D115]
MTFLVLTKPIIRNMSSATGSGSIESGKLYKIIQERLTKAFEPVRLEIENESHKHRHHAPMQGVQSTETHFRVRIISEQFEGLTLLKRQRAVYGLFKEEMQMEGGIHALALVTKTPEEVRKELTK